MVVPVTITMQCPHPHSHTPGWLERQGDRRAGSGSCYPVGMSWEGGWMIFLEGRPVHGDGCILCRTGAPVPGGMQKAREVVVSSQRVVD